MAGARELRPPKAVFPFALAGSQIRSGAITVQTITTTEETSIASSGLTAYVGVLARIDRYRLNNFANKHKLSTVINNGKVDRAMRFLQ